MYVPLLALSIALAANDRAATSASTPVPSVGRTRTYYIAADELIWDYAPTGINQITGKAFDEIQQTWTKAGPQSLGSKMKKALYREYTDATFRTLKPRAPQD